MRGEMKYDWQNIDNYRSQSICYTNYMCLNNKNKKYFSKKIFHAHLFKWNETRNACFKYKRSCFQSRIFFEDTIWNILNLLFMHIFIC